jgi:hypothetical protein
VEEQPLHRKGRCEPGGEFGQGPIVRNRLRRSVFRWRLLLGPVGVGCGVILIAAANSTAARVAGVVMLVLCVAFIAQAAYDVFR